MGEMEKTSFSADTEVGHLRRMDIALLARMLPNIPYFREPFLFAQAELNALADWDQTGPTESLKERKQ